MTSQSTSPSFQVTDPRTGTVSEQFSQFDDERVAHILAEAEKAQRGWAATTPDERANVVNRIADLLDARKDHLAEIVSREMGKSVSSAAGEIAYSASIYRYYADNAAQLLADVPIPTPDGEHAVIQTRPVGTVLGIMPWNYPHYQVARFVAPSLVLGNTIVLKHAENCPRTATEIENIIAEAGTPAGVYANLFVTHDQVAQIIADDRVAGVSFTGSERAGRIIGQTAGAHLKKVVLELGGSDPYIVLDSDDTAASAASAWQTRLANMGQACNSNKRLIIHTDLYDDFVEELRTLATAMEPDGSSDLRV